MTDIWFPLGLALWLSLTLAVGLVAGFLLGVEWATRGEGKR